jgi:hypothetical protein
MTTHWPPPKNLPPGFPLAPFDNHGRPIQVGAKVRILSVASAASSLTSEERARLRSYEGQTFEVLQIDRYGMLWFGSDGRTADFSVKPVEVEVEVV